MSLPLVFHPAVRHEVAEAYRWYEARQTGLGDAFLAELEAVYAALTQTPQMYRCRYRDVRVGLPRRFPYAIYYRVHSDRVEVIAVQHTRRNPAAWQSRADEDQPDEPGDES